MQIKYLEVRDVGRVGHVPDAGVGQGAENNPSRTGGARQKGWGLRKGRGLQYSGWGPWLVKDVTSTEAWRFLAMLGCGCAAVATAGPRRKLGQSDLQQNLGVEIDWDYEFIDQEVNFRIGEDLCNIRADVS